MAEHEVDECNWLLLDPGQPRVSPKEGFAGLRDPNRRPYKYVIAMLLAFTYGVTCYLADIPGGLQTAIIRVMRLDEARYDMIFSAYTWADIVMSIVGSVIVNQYIGIRIGFMIFLSLVLIGQILCSIGSFLNSFYTLLLGRLLFGAGTGTSVSILHAFQILWFGGKEITFVMSLGGCLGRTMATLALFTPQLTYNALSFIPYPFNRLGTTQMVGTLLALLAVISGLIVVLMDKHGAKMIGWKPTRKKARVNLCDAFRFPPLYWLAAIQCSLLYAVVISFTANGQILIVSKYGLSVEMANIANSLSYATMAGLAPFIAVVIDIVGYNLVWAFAGIMFMIISCSLHIVSGASLFTPFFAAALLSFSISFFGLSLWVAPGLIVDKDQVTTAYGIAMSMFATVMSLIGVISGVIIDNFGYLVLLIFNVVILFFVIFLNVYSSMLDYCARDPVLNVSGKIRRKRHAKKY